LLRAAWLPLRNIQSLGLEHARPALLCGEISQEQALKAQCRIPDDAAETRMRTGFLSKPRHWRVVNKQRSDHGLWGSSFTHKPSKRSKRNCLPTIARATGVCILMCFLKLNITNTHVFHIFI